MLNTNWKRATRCDNSGPNCLEAKTDETGETVYVRDTKNIGPFLSFTKTEWDTFLAGAKDGEFDLA